MSFVLVALCSVQLEAQEPRNVPAAGAANIVTIKPSNDAGSPAAIGAKALDISERERLLLERIDNLERRLAEVESRTAGKQTVNVASTLQQRDSSVS